MEMLRYADELRNPKDDEVPTAKPDKEMVDRRGTHRQKVRPVSSGQFEDHYRNALKKLVQAKSKGPQNHCRARRAAQEVRMRST